MQKPLLLVSALFLLFFSASGSFSQTKFNLSVYGGYSLPVADLKGDFPDSLGSGISFARSSTLLVSSGFNLGATGKYSVDTTGKARVTVSLGYNTFSGSQDYSRPSGTLTYKNKVNIFSISAGIEYYLFPKKKISPYGGLDLAANFFSGNVSSSGDSSRTLTRKSETRFGVIATGGVVIMIGKNTGVTLGVKYALANLIGKKSELTTTIINPNIDEEEEGSASLYELPLNDEENVNNRGKSLNYLQFFAGVSFNFGEALK
jgi:hypothetical protein